MLNAYCAFYSRGEQGKFLNKLCGFWNNVSCSFSPNAECWKLVIHAVSQCSKTSGSSSCAELKWIQKWGSRWKGRKAQGAVLKSFMNGQNFTKVLDCAQKITFADLEAFANPLAKHSTDWSQAHFGCHSLVKTGRVRHPVTPPSGFCEQSLLLRVFKNEHWVYLVENCQLCTKFRQKRDTL